MQLLTLAFLYGVQLVAAKTATVKSCTADNCLRAVIASNFPTRPVSADCSSFFKKTVYPATVTVTVPQTSVATVVGTKTLFGTETDTATVTGTQTGVVTVATTTTTTATQQGNAKRSVGVFSFPGYGLVTIGHVLEARQATVVPSSIPAYASPCSGSVRYSSACSCIGITQTTVTLSTPTTITSTTTRTTISTTTSTTSSTTTSTTISTITTTTASTTVVSTATVTAVPGHPDVPGFELTGCWDDLLYDFPGLAASAFSVGSIEECGINCESYTYFGLYDGYYCVCGEAFDLVSQVDESNCNIACSSNTDEFCGGPFSDAQGYPAWNFYSAVAMLTV